MIVGVFGDLFKSFQGKKKPADGDEDYASNPDDEMTEEDQLTLNKLIRERTKKGKRTMVEVE